MYHNRPARSRHARHNKIKISIIVLATSLLLAACSSSPTSTAKPTAANKHLTITIGTFPDPRPMGIVKEEGWLTKEGYNVVWDTFLNGVPGELAAMEGGSLEVAQLDTSGALPLFAKDPTLSWYVANETDNVAAVVARKGSGIHSVSQLRGKTIGTTGITTAPQVVLDMALADAHLPVSSNSYPQATGPDEVIAMDKGSVQAVTTYVPFSAQMITNGTGRLLITANQVYKNPWIAGGIVVTRAFGSAHPHAVEAILSAVMRAEALMKSNPKLADSLLAKYSGSPASDIAYSYSHDLVALTPLVPNAKALTVEANDEAKYGVFKGDAQTFVKSWVNTKFAQAVAK